MDTLPHRRHPVHHPPVERFNEPVVIFLTVCAKNYRRMLANDQIRHALLHAWERASTWRVGLYLIMPNHLHLFAIPGQWPPHPIKLWVKYWKGEVRKFLSLEESIWQRDCWDTQIRDFEHYEEKCAYVRLNPVRRGLVARPVDWKYQGVINDIWW